MVGNTGAEDFVTEFVWDEVKYPFVKQNCKDLSASIVKVHFTLSSIVTTLSLTSICRIVESSKRLSKNKLANFKRWSKKSPSKRRRKRAT